MTASVGMQDGCGGAAAAADCASYNVYTWRRLKGVAVALRQTQRRAAALQEQIESRLKARQDAEQLFNEVQQRRASVAQLRLFLERLNARRCLSSDRVAQLRQCLAERQSNVERLTAEVEQCRLTCEEKVRDYIAYREQLVRTNAQLALKRKEITGELGEILFIQRSASSSKGRCLCSPLYRIVSLHLPDAETYSKHSHLEVSSALGYAAQLVLILSKIFDVPLRYPIRFYGSKSSICDLTNLRSAGAHSQRLFPLFTRHQDKLMFEYGVFLLNKNIAQLRRSFGLATSDLRCTLANLGSLVEFLTGVRLDVDPGCYGAGSVHAPVSPGSSLCSWSTDSTSRTWFNANGAYSYGAARDQYPGRSSSLPSLYGDGKLAMLAEGCDTALDVNR